MFNDNYSSDWFEQDLKRLDRLFDQGKISPEDYEREVDELNEERREEQRTWR